MAMYVFPSSSCDGGEGTLGARRSRGGGRRRIARREGTPPDRTATGSLGGEKWRLRWTAALLLLYVGFGLRRL